MAAEASPRAAALRGSYNNEPIIYGKSSFEPTWGVKTRVFDARCMGALGFEVISSRS